MSESKTPRTNDHAEWLRNRAASPYFALARMGLLDSADAIERLESDLAAARAEVERLRKDAERLLWVLDDLSLDYIDGHDLHEDAIDIAMDDGRDEPTDEDFLNAARAAIDSALAAKEPLP